MNGAASTRVEGRAGETERWWGLGLGAVVVVVMVAVAYLPALGGGFLWDDAAHVPRADLRSLDGLRRIWFDIGATQQYYPLLFSWFWAQWQAFGTWTPGYHAVNMGLHAGAACLLMTLARRLLREGGVARADLAAWLAGAVWALHPVQVESVAWITEQKNTLSAVFYLLAMLAYLDFDAGRARGVYARATVLFVLALLSKPVTVTLPPVILVVLWWKRGGLSWRRDVVALLPWFGLSLASGVLTAWVEHSVTGAEGSEFGLAPAERLLLPGRVVLFYLGSLAWPADLIFVYPRWRVDAGEWWQWLYPAGSAALLAAAWSVRRRWRGPLAGLLIFAGTLFPVLGFFNVYLYRYTFVADHFQYLASAGVIVAACGAVAVRGGAALRAAAVVLPVVLGVLTWRQCGMYRDVETLYTTTIARNPGCWMAHNNLGVALNERGRRAEAIEHFRRALELKGAYPEASNNLGVALSDSGRRAEAIERFEEALRARPAYPEAMANLITGLTDAGRVQEAIVRGGTAVSGGWADAKVRTSLGNAMGLAGMHQDAAEEFRAALVLNPEQVEARWGLAMSLEATGRREEAIDAARRARGTAERAGRRDMAVMIEEWIRSRTARGGGPT